MSQVMTEENPSHDAAIEAAAKGIYECQPLHGFPSGEVISWDDLTAGAFAKRGLMIAQARAALEAAAPYMLATAWDEGRKHGATYPYGERGLATDDNPYRSKPSHDAVAEQSVLGAMLLEPTARDARAADKSRAEAALRRLITA